MTRSLISCVGSVSVRWGVWKEESCLALYAAQQGGDLEPQPLAHRDLGPSWAAQRSPWSMQVRQPTWTNRRGMESMSESGPSRAVSAASNAASVSANTTPVNRPSITASSMSVGASLTAGLSRAAAKAVKLWPSAAWSAWYPVRRQVGKRRHEA